MGKVGVLQVAYLFSSSAQSLKALLISLIFGRGPLTKPLSIFSLHLESANVPRVNKSAYLRIVVLLWNINSLNIVPSIALQYFYKYYLPGFSSCCNESVDLPRPATSYLNGDVFLIHIFFLVVHLFIFSKAVMYLYQS